MDLVLLLPSLLQQQSPTPLLQQDPPTTQVTADAVVAAVRRGTPKSASVLQFAEARQCQGGELDRRGFVQAGKKKSITDVCTTNAYCG
mmetsp:Transcript_51687/g.102779  ORF Transcript_51687/g.102779 Transcript_51687/m.102779 type:complete len:88 (-) Transcript_51687:30-293(-)